MTSEEGSGSGTGKGTGSGGEGGIMGSTAGLAACCCVCIAVGGNIANFVFMIMIAVNSCTPDVDNFCVKPM